MYLRCTYRVPRIDLRPASRPVDPPAASGSCRSAAASAVLAPHKVTDRGGRGIPQLRPCGSEAESGRGLRLAAARRADGDLVRAAARLNLPARQLDRALAVRPGTPGSGEGPRQVYVRSAPGIPEEILSEPPADVLFGLSWRVLVGHQDRSALRLDYLRKAIWGNESCPRGDLNTETSAISPDRGNHAITVTRSECAHCGIPRSVRYLVRYLACA